MADADLREAERSRDEGGGLVAEARLLVERVRAGELPRPRVELLANAGHGATRIAVGLEPLPRRVTTLEAFEQRLAETIVWCTERLGTGEDPARALRSETFAPVQTDTWDDATWMQSVSRIEQRRLELLRQTGWIDGARAETTGGGRLLCFSPSGSLSDGAAAFSTRGFFDDRNCPPYDTFVCWVPARWSPSFSSYVVCWVPPSLLELVGEGIGVNPEECIVWASGGTWNAPHGEVAELLRSAGFFA